MSGLKALFQKGFMKLTGGRKFAILATDELITTRDDWKELCSSYAEKHKLEERVQQLEEKFTEEYNNKLEEQVQQLEEKFIEEYNRGWVAGTNHSLPLTCEIPQDEEMVAIVSLIAKELIEQGDIESCEWLYNKIHQCRSL